MTNKLYLAINGNECVVTNDPRDTDIPEGVRAVPVSRFNAEDYVRLKNSGVTNFTFNSSNVAARVPSDSSPKTLSDYLLLVFVAIVMIVAVVLIVSSFA